MNQRHFPNETPIHKLFAQLDWTKSNNQVCQKWPWVRDAAEKLVASNTRKQYSVSLAFSGQRQLMFVCCFAIQPTWKGQKMRVGEGEGAAGRVHINVASHFFADLLNLRKVGPLISAWLVE